MKVVTVSGQDGEGDTKVTRGQVIRKGIHDGMLFAYVAVSFSFQATRKTGDQANKQASKQCGIKQEDKL